MSVPSATPEGRKAHGRTLLRLIRVAYPHPSFPDAPYERVAKTITEADGAGDADELLPDGLARLDELAGGDFAALDDDAATLVVEQVADSPFFQLVHATTIVALYDDPEVWDLLGYEGASYDLGGYLHRGFDDLDWLPRPRIEEYDGPARVEVTSASEAQA